MIKSLQSEEAVPRTNTFRPPIAYVPWVEKYRPSNLDQIASQDEAISVLKKSIRSSDVINLPHLLFYGPPGTGKTSTILALCKEIYGPEFFESRVMELNASDERGIGVIREKVKVFAQLQASKVAGPNFRVPSFKIIILDEADSLTNDAQNALRRIMEVNYKNTRFCIICNYISRIVPALVSRCAKFRFAPFKENALEKLLESIAASEGMNHSREMIHRIVNASGGDSRVAINFLQGAFCVFQDNPIAPEMIDELFGTVPDSMIENLVLASIKSDKDSIVLQIRTLINEGYAGISILKQVAKRIIKDVHLSTEQKCLFADRFAFCDRALVDGGSEFIQLLNALFSE